MAMTLELIQQLRGRAAFLRDKGRVKSPQLMEQAANELEAHLTQPAQAVDVVAGWNALLAEAKRLFLLQMAARQPGIDWSDRFHKLSADTRLEWVMQAADSLMPARALSAEKAEGWGPEGYVLVRKEAIDWLNGDSDFECPPERYFRGQPPRYWWRSVFREKAGLTLPASPTPDKEG